MHTIRYIWGMVAASICLPAAAGEMKIRAYKMLARNDKWCVQIRDQDNKLVSQSTFKKNTDGLTTKGLKLKIKANGYNVIYVYTDGICPEKDDSKASENATFKSEAIRTLPAEESQIVIRNTLDGTTVDILPKNSLPKEPTDSSQQKKPQTVTIDAEKIYSDSQEQGPMFKEKWLIETFFVGDDGIPVQRLSSTTIKRDTSFAKKLKVLQRGETYVFVRKDNNTVVATPVWYIPGNNRLLINQEGKAVLVASVPPTNIEITNLFAKVKNATEVRVMPLVDQETGQVTHYDGDKLDSYSAGLGTF